MVDANLKVENNKEISGMIQSRNVCGRGHYTIYYSIEFDQSFDSYSSWKDNEVGTEAERSGSNSGIWVNFNTKDNKVIQAKVGLSTIGVEQAKKERTEQVKDWNFDSQHQKTRKTWSDLLNKVEIIDEDEENKTVFYTQMYHSFLHPNNVTSSDGTFRAGRDEDTIRNTSEIGADFEYYNGWTTWDDFRKYSLYSLLEPQKYKNMVLSMIDLYKTRGSYVQWAEGYWPSPSVRNEFNGAVILDAYTKGFTFSDADILTALKGMAVDTDNYSTSDNEVSGKLEKAYSAYFPMKMAELIGDKLTYEKYKKIALSYKDLWNENQVDENGIKQGFFTPNAKTVNKEDIAVVDRYAYQGNLWTYRWFAMHDMNGLAELMGGKREMAIDLQHFFKIDEYMAVNETDLDVPFYFNYLRMPYLTQYYAREYTTEVVTQKYHNHGLYTYPMKSRIYRDDPEGYLLSMDDDAGAMASWFIYSALGLYPGNPGDAYYLIGSPIFKEVKMHLDGGKTFTIKANNVSSENRFIQSGTLNGKNFDQPWISYQDIMSGGTLNFEMGAEPNTDWGAKSSAMPPVTNYDAEIDSMYSQKQLIEEKSEWKYFDQGKAAGEGWTKLNFEDSEWASGKAMLGYDNNDAVETKVSFGPDKNNKYPTTYFRKTFDVEDIKNITELEASLIRDDGAIIYLNGHEIIRTNMPEGDVGYDTFANATVNNERDRNSYSIDPALLVEGTNIIAAEVHQVNATSSDIAFEFSLNSMKKAEVPDAPTNPVVDDEANTFAWTFVKGFDEVEDYEYSVNGGESWNKVTANPQIIGAADYPTGMVLVRVKGNDSIDLKPGKPLASNAPFTKDKQWNLYELDVEIKQEGNLQVNVSGKLKNDYSGSTTVVYQLMDKEEKALVTNAVPVKNGDFQHSQIFNVKADNYKVNVYLVDSFNGNIYESTWLANPVIGKAVPDQGTTPDPEPEPEPEIPDEEEPSIEPLPLPEKEEDEEEEEPESEDNVIEFEYFNESSSDVNTFNNGPLKTESNGGRTVVANTFDGAWLSYKKVDFGTEGKNQIKVDYDAPTNRVPEGAQLEIRLDKLDGELIGTVNLENTGSSWGTYKTADSILSTTLEGTHDIYIVMKGKTNKDQPYIGNLDKFSFDYKEIPASFGTEIEFEDRSEWTRESNTFNNGPLKTEKNGERTVVANTFDGAWLAYKKVDFGTEGKNRIKVEYDAPTNRVPEGAQLEIRLDKLDGDLIGTVDLENTGSGWGTYKIADSTLSTTVKGTHDIYIVMKGKTNKDQLYIGNLDKFSFEYEQVRKDYTNLELEKYDAWSTEVNPVNHNPLKVENGKSEKQVANTFDGAWLAYKNIDFGENGVNYLEIEYVSNSDNCAEDASVEVRLGSIDGKVIAKMKVPPTGKGWGTYNTVSTNLETNVSGIQDVYFILKGSTDSNYKYVGNFDRATFLLSQGSNGLIQ